MPQYECPECEAQLKVPNAIAPGKKIRCPKCDHIFAPSAAEGKPAAKSGSKGPAAPPAAADRNKQLEDAGGYGVVKEEAEDEEVLERKKAAFDPIKERFKRSARGPALIEVVKPSTWLLAAGVLTCVMAVTGGLYSVWPMIFKVEEVQPEDKMAKWKPPSAGQGRRFKEITDDERQERFIMLGGFIVQFFWGMLVCNGASHMHSLANYRWSMVGAVMSLVGAGVPFGALALQYGLKNDDFTYVPIGVLLLILPGLYVGPWCIRVLRKQHVIAGFEEEKPEDY